MKIKGFTLIELLIVVAIIAILAAIAVPNFLEAQVRSKVSRAEADMRSLATALESYFVDNNHYPWPYPKDDLYATNVPNELSSPIAYISSTTNIVDPFAIKPGAKSARWKRYGYIVDERYRTGEHFYGWVDLTDENELAIGKWRMDSFGPDERSTNWPNEPSYDPTNGTVSKGDLYRSQRDSIGKQL